MAVINLFLIALLIINATCQKAELKCGTDVTTAITTFTYYGRSFRNRCVFSNVMSMEDIASAKASGVTPTFSTDTIYTLVFVNSSLSELPDRFTSSYSNLRKLDASSLTLGSISPLAFSNTKNFELMSLANNNIKIIKARTFAAMNIKELDLSNNNLEVIEDTAFSGTEIEKLDLHYNKLKSIRFLNSFGYFNLVGMNNNAFTTIDQIEPKKDGWVNRRTSSFIDPTYPKLFFQNNPITKFICSSTIQLETIDFESNTELTEISLNDCSIEDIDVTNCPSLKKVSLNDNLRGFTARNVNLNDIDLSSAKFLTTVSVANCSISPKIFESITKMENLTMLDLSYNNIGPLNISSFARLKNLQILNLKASNISNIEFGTFSHQTQVKQLDVSDNKLKYFDMNMIFAMNHLLVLDLSGNELDALENFETSHYTFTLLHKIDLSNNNWPCSYLLRMIKVFRVYKVMLITSFTEENHSNIQGIRCVHVPGEDDGSIEPLEPGASNFTEIQAKMNEIIAQMEKITQSKTVFESRIRQLEINKASSEVISAALRSEKSQTVEVRNGTLLESALVIVCICFVVFMALKAFVFVKDNFFRTRTRRTTSEHTLAMTVDDY